MTLLPRSERQFGLAALLVATCAVSFGCRDSGAPQYLSGTYVLASINGNAVPATLSANGGYQYIIVADTLVFFSGGTAVRTRVARYISPGPVPAEDTSLTRRPLPYSIEGRTLILGLRITCGPAELCTSWEEGTIEHDRISVAAAYSRGTPVLSYVRQ